METPKETLDEQRERRQFEKILETFDDETLAEMRREALESYSELEKLILAISRIQDERVLKSVERED